MAQLTLKEWIIRAENDKRFMENVTAFKRLDASSGGFSPYPAWVDKRIKNVLEARGIKNLYSHQSEAIELVRKGRDVVLVTPTASGKTLCYNIPVLQAIIEKPETRALYMFPTKALAQDQMQEAHSLITELDMNIRTFTYDGDTPDDARQAIRRQGHIVITNPDMLHTGILPHHTKWQKLFADLKYIVVDELHIYRGIFGSHLANVFRRLRRICNFYGSNPVFICCSATVANPREHSEAVLGREAELIDKNGAPRGERTVILYNPPVVNRELGIRQSAMVPAREITKSLIDNGIQTIAFATSRLNVEVLTKYLKDAFAQGKLPEDSRFISGYRGGYLPETRREIEKGLRDKEVMGVVSTNALELGIDIGNLEACVMTGYPGSIASLWQQAGRAGRKKDASLAILVGKSMPVDQFMMENPEFLFGSPPEHCRINPDNLLILLHHIKCAAFELPFTEGESFGNENIKEILDYLAEKGVLHKAGEQWHFSADSYPADDVSLRTVNPDNVVIVDETVTGSSRIIAEVDFDSAFTTVHEGAIYMLESRQYHVDRFDVERRKAYVHQVDSDYYTDAMTWTNVCVLDEFSNKNSGVITVAHGEVEVVRKVAGFKKIKFYTGENVGFGDVNLPQNDMHTTSYWFTIPWKWLDTLELTRGQMLDGLMGLSYCLHQLAAIWLMSDVRDIDRAIGDKTGQWYIKGGRDRLATTQGAETPVGLFDPTIFIFDAYPGGIGFSELLYEMHEDILTHARTLINVCPCENGCPSCVGPRLEVGPDAKYAALEILHLMLGK